MHRRARHGSHDIPHGVVAVTVRDRGIRYCDIGCDRALLDKTNLFQDKMENVGDGRLAFDEERLRSNCRRWRRWNGELDDLRRSDGDLEGGGGYTALAVGRDSVVDGRADGGPKGRGARVEGGDYARGDPARCDVRDRDATHTRVRRLQWFGDGTWPR